ncbi:MAG: nitroreductase family protein, partial [Candidatus Poribacteria bacterium]
MEHLILAATERGLGTCWIGWFDEETAKKALGAPKEMRLVATTPLGYPDESPKSRGRKELAEITSFDKYE